MYKRQLDDYLRQLESIGVHAVIVASPTIVRHAKTVAPKLEVHLSTQMSSTNSQAVRFYQQLGADRVVPVSYTHLDVYKRQSLSGSCCSIKTLKPYKNLNCQRKTQAGSEKKV